MTTVTDHLTLNGERITLSNAQRLVSARFPWARCDPQKGNDGARYYLVYLERRTAGQMYSGSGDRKANAWRDAAESIARRDAAQKAAP